MQVLKQPKSGEVDRAYFNKSVSERVEPVMPSRFRSRNALLLFVILTFAWSWGFEIMAMRVARDTPTLHAIFLIVATFGPSLAGIATMMIFSDRSGFREWVKRCLERRIAWHWFLLAFLAPPLVMACALALHVGLGGTLPAFPAVEKIPLAIANFGFVFLIGGPLGEEFGWRGYLMPAITPKLGWRAASLVIGLIWGFWHLPLFFLPVTTQAQIPIPTFLLNILAGSFLFGWLFHHTRASVLPALVMHTSLNTFAGLLSIVPTPGIQSPYLLTTGLLVLLAIVLSLVPNRKPALKREAH